MEKLNLNFADYDDPYLKENFFIDDNIEVFEDEENIRLDSLSIFLSDMEGYGVLTAEEEKNLALRKSEGDMEARQLLINHNIRLVIHIAKKYANMGLDFEDVVQQGIIGLMKAVDGFDYRYGFKLSTYATPAIKREILRMTRQPNIFYRVPEYCVDLIYKKKVVIGDYRLKYGENPTDEYVADALQISLEKLYDIEISEMNVLSLDMEIYARDGDPITLQDTLESKNPSSEDIVESNELKRIMQECVMSIKNERVRKVVIERFGLDGNDPKTLQEIADEMHVSRERIRQLESKGLAFLRNPNMQKKFKQFLKD